ncbi:TolC family protein [Pseudoduganella violacea]|uniref:Outer membrane protein TolC n=1 Tax=Pseudoduganella violacea TaxID=1715466 RepID=A0A7W5BDF0_9BURK|nr:TolC family protein [Pseudoduganella violacea]MBB3121167.1 outer membrane protein TolC [Pseudoduganella violacea]
MSARQRLKPRHAGLALLALLLSGCASFSPDGGFGVVSPAVQSRTGAETRLLRNEDDQRALGKLIAEKLAQELSADDAVQIALLNNRGLQARYWEMGIAEADLVQAGRLQNPGFSFKRSHGGGELEIERTFTFNLVNLITAPLAQRIEGRRFEQTKLAVAEDAIKLAAETRRAYYEAVAAEQGVEYSRQIAAAADASAELAERMRKAGNWSKFDLAREQAFYAEAMAEVARAGKAATACREKLTRLMGLWGADTGFKLPQRLPELPASAAELHDVEQGAMRNRIDIQAATLETQHTASSLGLNKATRFINALELGVVRERKGEERMRGYELTLEIPLFDWGSSRVARAEAVYMQSANRLAETAVQARSEARESYLDYRSSYDVAKHYRDVVIPLRKQLSDETLLRYNGMLLSVFELLADSREQTATVKSYIEALKDFWIAHANLEAATGTRLNNAPAAAPTLQKETPAHDHSNHGAHQ